MSDAGSAIAIRSPLYRAARWPPPATSGGTRWRCGLRPGRADPYPIYEADPGQRPAGADPAGRLGERQPPAGVRLVAAREAGGSASGRHDGANMSFLGLNPPDLHPAAASSAQPAFEARRRNGRIPRSDRAHGRRPAGPGRRRDEFDLVSAGRAAASRGHHRLQRLFEDLFELRRREPADDIISRLVAAQGDQVKPAEMLPMCVLLLVAGFETTVNLIGNSVLALLGHREQWQDLCADPQALAARAVEETIRRSSSPTGWRWITWSWRASRSALAISW